jgi:hypothetical protein
MKGLKKLALVTAVAAAPFAQAEMTAMDDALLGEMTGQAGITIDVDLAMTIDAIKYVDRDGNVDGGADAVQGAITLNGLTVGSIADDGTLSAARIRGVTIDADGTDGLVIGLNQIGDTSGNGIDITVDAVIIGSGAANLAKTQAGASIATANATYSTTYTTADYQAGVVTADMQTLVGTAIAGSSVAEQGAAAAAAIGAGDYADSAEFAAALAAGEEKAVGHLGNENAGVAAAATQAAMFTGAGADLATAASGADGVIGGFKIENFRNYIQDDLVNEYNGVFDMALQDSSGNVGGVTGAPGTTGRFIRGEIVVNGTGNLLAGTSGLNISGEFGGAMDQAAWVDEGNEFGVADLGFFHGVDTNEDGIADVIEGMHFEMDIDVVQHQSWNNTTENAGVATADVAALKISGIKLQGTIMMGSLYLDGTNMIDHDNNAATADIDGIAAQSLGSVLIKDINMEGTSVYVYGH